MTPSDLKNITLNPIDLKNVTLTPNDPKNITFISNSLKIDLYSIFIHLYIEPFEIQVLNIHKSVKF